MCLILRKRRYRLTFLYSSFSCGGQKYDFSAKHSARRLRLLAPTCVPTAPLLVAPSAGKTFSRCFSLHFDVPAILFFFFFFMLR